MVKSWVSLDVKTKYRHTCSLPQHSYSCLPLISPAKRSPLLRFIRAMRKVCLISSKHHVVRSNFMSLTALIEERRRHMRTNKITIHPYSFFTKYYEITMAFLWLISLFKDPFLYGFMPCFDYGEDEGFIGDNNSLLFNAVLDHILMFMSLFNFVIGYVDGSTNQVELSFKRIAKRYLITYFLFDMCLLPFYWMYFSRVKSVYLWYIILLLVWWRIVRMTTVIRYMRQITLFFGMDSMYHDILMFGLRTIHLVHWFNCLYAVYLKFLIDAGLELSDDLTVSFNYETASIYRQYLMAMHVTCNHLFSTCLNLTSSTADCEQVFHIIVLSVGNMFIGYVICRFFVLVKSTNSSHAKYDELINELQNFTRVKKMSIGMRTRLLKYYRIKFQERYFKEASILSQLTDSLYREVKVCSNADMLNQAVIFQGLPQYAVEDILCRLNEEFYLENDVITIGGSQCDSVHILAYGTTAVYNSAGTEVMHFNDNEHFGLLPLIDDSLHGIFLTSNVAVTHVHVYKLHKKDFWECINKHPAFKKHIVDDFINRKTLYSGRKSHVENELKVLHELAAGLILEKLKKRSAY